MTYSDNKRGCIGSTFGHCILAERWLTIITTDRQQLSGTVDFTLLPIELSNFKLDKNHIISGQAHSYPDECETRIHHSKIHNSYEKICTTVYVPCRLALNLTVSSIRHEQYRNFSTIKGTRNIGRSGCRHSLCHS